MLIWFGLVWPSFCLKGRQVLATSNARFASTYSTKAFLKKDDDEDYSFPLVTESIHGKLLTILEPNHVTTPLAMPSVRFKIGNFRFQLNLVMK